MANHFLLAAQLLIVTVTMTCVNGQNHSAFMSSDGWAQTGSIAADFPTGGGLNETYPFLPAGG